LKKILPNQLQKTLNEVNVLFSRGNIEASEKILNELIVSFPSHPDVLSKLGTIYLYQDRLSDGILLIKKSLEVNPYQPDILNNYAVALLNTKQFHEALEIINKAIKIKPDYVDAYYHQGLIYKSLESYDDALNAYLKTIQLMPSHENAILNSAAIYIQLEKYNEAISILSSAQLTQPSPSYFYNLGLAHLNLEHFIEADQLFNYVVRHDPNYGEAWNNLGLALKGLDRFEDAVHCIEKAIFLNNQNAEAYDNKGLVLIQLERFDEALIQFHIALKLKPDDHEIYNNIGIAFKELRRFDEALKNFNHALELMPAYAEAINNRGVVYQELLKSEEALIDFNRAIEINPSYAEAYNNRGLLFKDQRLFDKAIQDIKYALELDPKLIETYFNLSLIYLLKLEFKEGWACYEKRKKISDYLKKTEALNKPYLNQIPEHDEPILLHSEQGIGDQIIYLSLLHQVMEWSNPILVQIDPRLIPLFKRSFPNIYFYSDKEALNPDSYKYHALVGSLPKLFRNSKESFLGQKKSFLTSDQNKTSALREKLLGADSYVCGISWKSKNEKFGQFKTASLNDFLPVLKLPSINFVDLQYGETLDERLHLKNEHSITLTKLEEIDNFNDIDGLASLIDACDFIVTISNVTAHIAGALGKKVFLMVPYEKGKIWYWHDNLKISLWYPTIHIFTQTKTGEWTTPINEIKEQLLEQVDHE
jgi:tetratricopeptide (TPR) repeat protein